MLPMVLVFGPALWSVSEWHTEGNDMALMEVQTLPCLGCGDRATFTMTEEQFNRWKSGEHLQFVFPDWSPEDREMLISGTCPDCWEEMWAEEEDWVEDPDNDPLAFPLEYEPDWYVD